MVWLKTNTMARRYQGHKSELRKELLASEEDDELWGRGRSRSPKRSRESLQKMEQDPAPGPSRPMQLGNNPAQGNGEGSSGSGNAPVEQNNLRFGKRRMPYTKNYKRTFLITVDNGVQNLDLSYTQAVIATPAKAQFITWNEGWQIIPWGSLEAYLTPMDFWELQTQCAKWRVKKVKVTVEGLIPFQVDLTGGANTTTATFTNRVNMHVYVDDGKLLPDLDPTNINDISHSDNFCLPWGTGTSGKLFSPSFKFQNAKRPADYRYSKDVEFITTKPQKYFSLYNTGQVSNVYPGQKFEKEWENDCQTWMGRAPNDALLRVIKYDGAASTAILEQNIAGGAMPSYHAGIRGRGDFPGDLPLDPTTSAYKSNYMDTGLPIRMDGTPYILVRAEPYPNLGAAGGLVNIYLQAHIHYEMEIEAVPLENPTTYIPFYSGVVVGQTSSATFNQQVRNDTAAGITGNLIGNMLGTDENDTVYS